MAWGEKTQIKAAGTWGWLPGQSAEGAVGWIRRAIAASRVKWNLHRKVVASISDPGPCRGLAQYYVQ